MTISAKPLTLPCLGVNIDHIATLRNVRGTDYPDVRQAALEAEAAGADLITLHLREDRRHIRDEDVRKLRPLLQTSMNLECAITNEMLEIACEVRPQEVCLVPEKRKELTTEGGLDVIDRFKDVQAACKKLNEANVKVALFIDADEEQIRAASQTGAKAIELHTGLYAGVYQIKSEREIELDRLTRAVDLGRSLGLTVNAGHGLHEANVQPIAALEGIKTLNIGHALVARALFIGWTNAVREMKALMVSARLSAMHS